VRSSKLIPNSTNPSSKSPDDGKTKIFVPRFDRISKQNRLLIGNFVEFDLDENVTIDVVTIVESIQKLSDLLLLWLQRYSLINF
jgi:hypothetical protein